MSGGRGVGVAVGVLAALHMTVVLAGLFAPYDSADQNRTLAFAPPTRVHVAGPAGGSPWRPFVCRWALAPNDPGSYAEDCSRVYPVRFLVRGAPYRILGAFSSRWHLFGVDDRARIFLLGSDAYGRDVFSRLLYGGQVSLLAGALAAGLSLCLGLLLGIVSGFLGGRTDEGMMRLAELFLALPWLYLLLAVRAFLPLGMEPRQAFLLLVLVMGVVGWARPARLVRGAVLSARERRYVLAARGFGASTFYMMRRHVLPQVYPVLLTHATILVPAYIVGEVTLSFLGLGVGEPTPSWGNMMSALQQYHVLSSYWWMFAPGVALVLVSLSYYALANRWNERFRLGIV